MSQIKKNILLSVTGMSPAVITETLYALVTEKKFIPTELHVITTLPGKEEIMDALLGIEGGRKKAEGALAEFCADYHLPAIHFDESCIHVIQNSENMDLTDIRTPEENKLAADQIVGLVSEFCQRQDTALHASIAGGRKTMGFFLGYALSLYGREQDSLSHVLVEERYENLPTFFYPKPNTHMINDLEGIEIDVSQAKVMLAEIPWVRLGLGVPDGLLRSHLSYSQSVEKAQNALQTPTITFLTPIDDRKVRFGCEILRLSPRGYALLLSLCLFKKRGLSYQYESPDENKIQKVIDLYMVILKSVGNESTRLGEDFKSLLSESKTDITKKYKAAIGLNNNSKNVPYIPSSKSRCYTLGVEAEHIDLTAIEAEIKACRFPIPVAQD
ncbi:CRISPR-associated ring nuclease Csm6 [Testudinibacter sp. P80/BLE/0925]|uniref:CRISPR-associated ring nuclease Csm6 n=1 Tax=Testudinibacter sp. TW-1 TaxID=3417757 RepID=UPI003D367384